MAIAYFIPDQAKLLARSQRQRQSDAGRQATGNVNTSREQRNNQSANRRSSTRTATTTTTSTTTRNTSTSTTTTTTTPRQQEHYSQQQQNFSYTSRNNQFRANISIPLSRQQGSMSTQTESIGCWELLAQIFCYALRLYNYNATQRSPTVIQISFEISCRHNTRAEAAAGSSQDATDGKPE